MEKTIAYYHLPGLFEFYELYRVFLPLYRAHREYFYDGSIYGAPPDCIWGGGRIGSGDCAAQEPLALTREYGVSARLTFSNSLLREEHLTDQKCNALCRLFSESDGPQNGVIVHSELLLRYLRERYPKLYFVSSTTKVLTAFPQLQAELARDEFRFVVPDFRLNRAFDRLNALPEAAKDKVELLSNECCWFDCKERSACYEAVKISVRPHPSISAPRRTLPAATASRRPWKIPALSAWKPSGASICPWASPISRLRAAASAAL